ncbi:HupE/UreJ family protein [Agrobacterium vitis]|uniref:HupE/UreJ family protein n=1 Tax=Agrobacterium vitis TaxID=373 RepID=UPI001F1D79AF|nr:HupE/UreJ family protein [Agrobacterium vitis]
MTFAVVASTPTAAFAHVSGSDLGFTAGLAHPISGLDHLLAMVMVGFLAAHVAWP